MRTVMMVLNGVTMQYDQKIVRDMRRSNASPDDLCVIWANVRAGGAAMRRTFTTTKIGLSTKGFRTTAIFVQKMDAYSSNTAGKPYFAEYAMSGISMVGVRTILERIAIITVLVSPFL